MRRDDGCGVGLIGLGVGLPETVRTNGFWAGRLRDAPPSADFVSGAEEELAGRGTRIRAMDDPFRGTRERRVLEDHLQSSDMEAVACRRALASAGADPGSVDLLLGYSVVPDDVCPNNAGRVGHLVGVGRDVTAMGVDAGCASFLPQLTTAVRLVGAGDHALGLLYQSSAASRIADWSLPSSVLLGDGAVAEVVGRVDAGLGFVGGMQQLRTDLREGVIIGRADGDPRWYAGSAAPIALGSRDREAARAMGVEGAAFAREACRAVLDRYGYAPSDVDFFVCAQATAWFGEACAEAVGIPADRVTPLADHFERFGHLLAASVSLNLWVAWTTGRLRKGDLVLVYSPGVGFVQAAALLRWAMDPPGITSIA